MSLTENTRPYETLIRHHEDGTISVQHENIVEIKQDDLIVATKSQGLIEILDAAELAALVDKPIRQPEQAPTMMARLAKTFGF